MLKNLKKYHYHNAAYTMDKIRVETLVAGQNVKVAHTLCSATCLTLKHMFHCSSICFVGFYYNLKAVYRLIKAVTDWLHYGLIYPVYVTLCPSFSLKLFFYLHIRGYLREGGE